MRRESLSLVGLGVAVLGLVGLLLMRHLFATAPALIAVQVGAVLLMLWARFTFGLRSFHAAANPSAGGLVTHGPYRYWRHPIYTSILYFVWAGQVQDPKPAAVGLALLITGGLVTRMLVEESFLRVAYPEYGEYARHTKRFVPFVF